MSDTRMRLNFNEWIASVQQKPESVRLRYVVICAGVAMLFVLGVWSLSMSESLRSLSTDARNAADTSQTLLPKASDFSLDALISGEKSLEERKKEVSGELFFQQELESKQQPNFDEDGFVPKSPEAAPTTPAEPTDPSPVR